MPSLYDHMAETEENLGDSFERVHRWLDELALRGLRLSGHRAYRHHREGIEEVRKKWGDAAAEAAEMHVRADTGHIPSEEDYETGRVTEDGFLPGETGSGE